MRHHIAMLLVSLLWVGAQSHAHGQEETERFIPIGRSPGLSGAVTDIGTVSAFDSGSRILKIDAASGPQSVEVTERTRIWVDRSKAKLSNLNGSPDDLAAGRMVEVKYVDATAKRDADWIKVEMAN